MALRNPRGAVRGAFGRAFLGARGLQLPALLPRRAMSSAARRGAAPVPNPSPTQREFEAIGTFPPLHIVRIKGQDSHRPSKLVPGGEKRGQAVKRLHSPLEMSKVQHPLLQQTRGSRPGQGLAALKASPVLKVSTGCWWWEGLTEGSADLQVGARMEQSSAQGVKQDAGSGGVRRKLCHPMLLSPHPLYRFPSQ